MSSLSYSLERLIGSYLQPEEREFLQYWGHPNVRFIPPGAKRLSIKRVLRFVVQNGWTEALEIIWNSPGNTGGGAISDLILSLAAGAGREDYMALAKSRGATKVDDALAYAAEAGSLSAMTLLNSWGAIDVESALCYAAGSGKNEAVQQLIHWGASDDHLAAMCYAVEADHISTLEILMKRAHRRLTFQNVNGENYQFNVVCRIAAETGNTKAINLFMRWNLSINSNLILERAAEFDQADMITLIMLSFQGLNLLYPATIRAVAKAAKRNSCNALRELRKRGAKGNILALHNAAEYGNVEALRILYKWAVEDQTVENLVNLPQQLDLVEVMNTAAAFDQNKIMEYLKDVGTPVDEETAKIAIEEGSLSAVRLLKEWGAIANLDFALEHAAGFGRLKVMKLLKGWGASDLNRALDVAAEEGELKAMARLKEWGANVTINTVVVSSYQDNLDSLKLIRSWNPKFSESDIEHLISELTPEGEVFINPGARVFLRAWFKDARL